MSRVIRSRRIGRWGLPMNSLNRIKLKYVADYIQRGDAPTYVDSNGVAVVNQACVQQSGVDLLKIKLHDPEDMRRIASWLQPGDVLINSTGTGTLGRVAHVRDQPNPPMFADGHVTIIRDSARRFEPRYLFYVLSVQQEQITVECAEGATNQIELSRHRLGNKYIDWPSIERQRQVVVFLDRSTGTLDKLIAGKKHLLDLLIEKRHVLVAHAVTRGLNSKVSRQDSGIPWLEKIPAHWRVVRAKTLFREIDERSHTGEEVLLSLRMTKGLVPHNDVSEKVITPDDLIGYKKAFPQQIVVNRMRAASGLIAVVPQAGLVSPDYAVFESVGEVNPDFFTYLFRTPLLQAVFRSESKGLGTGQSGFLRLYSENFLAIHMPVPPIEEQCEILRWVQVETKKIDDLVVATERTVTLLQERRSALIAAAITGTLGSRNAN